MPKGTDKLAHKIRDEYERKNVPHDEAERIGHSTVNKMKSKGLL